MCQPVRGPFHSLEDIAANYRQRYAGRARDELTLFSSQPTFDVTVRLASRAEDDLGKRLAHQRRLPRAALARVEDKLLASKRSLGRAKTFAELHATVADLIGHIRGVGELMIYDTALRIGAWRRLKPKEVYLHAGTRAGARALGLESARASIPRAALPRALRELASHEIEDVLCIYKDQLSYVRHLGCDI